MEQTIIEAIQSLSEKITRTYPAYQPTDVLDNDEVCKVLHCTVRAIDAYVSEKGLPCHKAGVKRLFFYGEVIAWLRGDGADKEVSPARQMPRKSIQQKFRKGKQYGK